MEELLYDIFIRGVIPIAVVGLLGYYGKLFFEKHKNESIKIIGIILSISIWLLLSYLIYVDISNGYLKEYLPGETLIVGATSIADSSGVYWEIDPGKINAIPLKVKPDRIIKLKLQSSHYPILITYQIGNAFHSITINNIDEPIFNLPLEELINSQKVISNKINSDGECILNLRFTVNKPIKLFSFSLERYFPTSIKIILTLLLSFIIGFALITVNYLLIKLKPKANSV